MDSKRIHALLDPFPGTFDMLVVLPRLASTKLREFHSGRKIQESVVQQAEAFLKAALKEEMRGWPAGRPVVDRLFNRQVACNPSLSFQDFRPAQYCAVRLQQEKPRGGRPMDRRASQRSSWLKLHGDRPDFVLDSSMVAAGGEPTLIFRVGPHGQPIESK